MNKKVIKIAHLSGCSLKFKVGGVVAVICCVLVMFILMSDPMFLCFSEISNGFFYFMCYYVVCVSNIHPMQDPKLPFMSCIGVVKNKKRLTNFLPCFISEERFNRKCLEKSIKEYYETKTLASLAIISLKSGTFSPSSYHFIHVRVWISFLENCIWTYSNVIS